MARNSLHRFVALTHLLIVAITLGAVAQAPQPEPLNSERIAAKFGSYGIAVLEQDASVRVSNLFSGTGDDRTCRTFAVVRYVDRLDPALREAHDEIVAGGSMGAVLAAHGFEVHKTHLRYGQRPASAKLAALMGVPIGTPLAEHAYVLDAVRNERSLEYAALVEIHHPDYLGVADLAAIYGPPSPAGRRRLVRSLLATAETRAR